MNHELKNKFPNMHIYIPTAKKESKLGYDLKMQFKRSQPIFIQYKVPSMEYKKMKFNFKTTPIFRMELHKDRKTDQYKQHNRLLSLSKRGFIVLYATPPFISYKELYTYSNLNKLIYNTVFLKPTHKINDSDHHFVKYNKNKAFLFSKTPKKLEEIKFSEIVFNNNKVILESLKEELNDFYNEENISLENVDFSTKLNTYLFKNNLLLLLIEKQL